MRLSAENRGFTLIELLVVIAIIAILASILFPVFARAREKARESSCMSNEKQIGLAIHMYSTDYDELMPIACYKPITDPAYPGCPGLKDVIMPYVKNTQVFRCPSDKGDYWKNEGTSYDYGTDGFAFLCYSVDQPFNREASVTPILWDFAPDWHTRGYCALYGDGHVKVKSPNT